DCHCCSKDVIPSIKRVFKQLKEFYSQDENPPENWDNKQYALLDPFLGLKDATPTIYFSVVVDKLLTHQLQYCSKWNGGEQLKEVLAGLDKHVNSPVIANKISYDKDTEISERLHHLADDLPDHASVPVDVLWFSCGKNSLPIRCVELVVLIDLLCRSHLHLFGAFKRLQEWNNANITVLCSDEFDRETFSKTWQKDLNISVMLLNKKNPDSLVKLLDPSVVWQGSLVISEDQSEMKLPGFRLWCEKSKKNIQFPLKRQRKSSTEDRNSDLCIGQEITILCKVQKHSVPLHMFVPVKMQLKLACCSIKTSARLVQWLSFEVNKDVAFIGRLKLTQPTNTHQNEKSKEAWFNFVKAESYSATISETNAGEEDKDDCSSRLCLICGGAENGLNVFVLRAPEHLNGRIQHDLATVHSSVPIINDQEVGGPLRFLDLEDSFFETEQKLTEILLSMLQQELGNSTSDDQVILDASTKVLDQLVSAKLSLLKEKREQLLQAGKEHELDVVTRESLLLVEKESLMSPSRWPERAWLIKNDPNAVVKDAAAKDSTLLASVTTMSIHDILEKFRLDGTAVASNLSPVKPRERGLLDRHIEIGAKRDLDVRERRYPDALTASYHGIEYCLDNRDAITKDSQLSSLQSSHVKFETLSTCVQRDNRPLETRSTRTVTKAAKNDTKQSLMKLSVPLMRTKAAGKGKRPAAVERPVKRKSPVVRKPAVAAAKRKRQESSTEETKPHQNTQEDKKKETRSERHKRRLRQVVQKTLQDNGIDSNHAFYHPCTERLYSLCKSFLKDLRSSHGLNDEMKRLASSNVQQVQSL
ncbi:unnamed protein product, partial [Porites evermanni]